ncbi:COG4223 family protein [Jiella avicenniae]|uniref:Inner membrane protein n=1 Tax=Jiella avicenniae TaxID=2907202 RepID=A0A9X1NZY8_9HYPH|nr:mitofilin family membrane protein [Jiella avicenniae]MCE7027968.1 hypothetical protein [Jiella avicenniae]
MARSETGRASPPPPSRSGGVGAGGVIGAALLGAVLALGGAWVLAANGVLPGFSAAPQAEDGDYATTDALNGVNEEVARLRDQLAAGESGEAAPAVDLAPLEQRITALENSTADLTSLRQSAEEASRTATTAQEGVQGATEASERSSRDAADALKQASAANQTAGAAQQAATNAQQTANSAQSTAQSALEAAESAAENATSANEAASAASSKVDGAVTDLGQRLAAVEEANKRAATALAAANLKSAIDAGGPFAEQLETYATTAGAGEATESLRTFAAEGVPSERQIAQQWPEVESRISAALSPPRPNAPVGDQFMAGLRSLVNVRSSDTPPPADQSDSAVLARLDAAIRSGDLEGFVSEWDELPENAKEASADFADNVKARLTAQQIVSSTLQDAITGSEPASTDAPTTAEPANQG